MVQSTKSAPAQKSDGEGAGRLEIAELAARIERETRHLTGAGLLRAVIQDYFPDRVAMVSSFGAESAVLLDLVAGIRPSLPVVFLNTGKLFGETRRYRDQLADALGLTDVRDVTPDAALLAHVDPAGDLWMRNPTRCCYIRKVAPLEAALQGFDAWITGRKRFQSDGRSALPRVEAVDGRIKINPLADWTPGDVDAHFLARGLPRHPLVEDGYLSIGCMPCTDRVAPGEDMRDGRWRGREKTECGIHVIPDETHTALPPLPPRR